MMSRKLVYQLLENEMVKYSDLINMRVKSNSEKLVPIKPTSRLVVNQIDKNMYAYTGSLIYVRRKIAEKLQRASTLLYEYNPSLSLEVIYGYRPLSIQKKLFIKYRNTLKEKFTGLDLMEATHRLIAVPKVSGHPTGGAVDVQILKSNKPISMGTRIWQFVEDSYTFSPFISQKGKQNRQLLRKIMLKVGFAPFDGEWWHFSYGDKEWAKYYDKPYAVYDQIEYKKEV